MNSRIIFTTFTDPMMGLTYEMEPIYDRLKHEYGDRIGFHWVMGLLVRDVSDFMTPQECAMQPEAGIRAYNARLGIHSLPACLIQCSDKALLLQSFAYEDYADAIKRSCRD